MDEKLRCHIGECNDEYCHESAAAMVQRFIENPDFSLDRKHSVNHVRSQ